MEDTGASGSEEGQVLTSVPGGSVFLAEGVFFAQLRISKGKNFKKLK